MGSRPSSDLIYGFVWTDERDWSDEDAVDPSESFSELEDSWTEQVYASAGIPDKPETREQWQEWHASKVRALRSAGQIIRWGARFDDPCWAFGFVLASGDWDAPADASDLTIPDDAEAKLRKLAEFFGVEVKPAKMLLLSSYG